MSSYTALAEVGESIAGVLWQEIQLDPVVNALIDTENKISLKSPADLANDVSVRLSIYLYRVRKRRSVTQSSTHSGSFLFDYAARRRTS
jgi:hypothetical protein